LTSTGSNKIQIEGKTGGAFLLARRNHGAKTNWRQQNPREGSEIRSTGLACRKLIWRQGSRGRHCTLSWCWIEKRSRGKLSPGALRSGHETFRCTSSRVDEKKNGRAVLDRHQRNQAAAFEREQKPRGPRLPYPSGKPKTDRVQSTVARTPKSRWQNRKPGSSTLGTIQGTGKSAVKTTLCAQNESARKATRRSRLKKAEFDE
jgi:hypothetical protein